MYDLALLLLAFPPLAVAAPLYGGIAAGIGSLFGAKTASSSAKSINAQQIALSREQMKFQERMSNTAYQRSTKDLEAAGLNRILALGKPASSPGGAQPPSLKVPGEYIQRGISSALQNANIGAQIAHTNALTKKANNEADVLGPKALVQDELLKLLQRLIPAVKEDGPSLLDRAADIGENISNSAKDFGTKIGILDPKPARKETGALIGLEITFDPRANEVKNVADFAAHYERTENKKPTKEILYRAADEIRRMLKRNN